MVVATATPMPADMPQALLLLLALALLGLPLGCHFSAVFAGRRTRLSFLVGPAERALVAVCGRAAVAPMDWKAYATASILFGMGATILVNLAGLRGGLMASLAGAAADFAQAMAGLAVWGALARRVTAGTLGHVHGAGSSNFWEDMIRSTLHIGLPFSLLFAIVLVSQGTPQSPRLIATVPLIEPITYEQPVIGENGRPIFDSGRPLLRRVEVGEQSIVAGPVATNVALKMMRAADAPPFEAVHPFSTPTPLANFVQMLWALLMPAALCVALASGGGRRAVATGVLLALLAIAAPLVLMAFSWAAGQGGDFAETRLGDFGSLFWTSGAVPSVFAFGTVPGLARLLAGLIIAGGLIVVLRRCMNGGAGREPERDAERDVVPVTAPALLGAMVLVFASCIPWAEQFVHARLAGSLSGWVVLPAIAAIAFAGMPAAGSLMRRWSGTVRAAGVVLGGVALGVGVLVPVLVTGLAMALPATHSNHDPNPMDGGRVAGSVLIGQEFGEPVHFWGRVSATRPYPYNAMAVESDARDRIDGSWRRRRDAAIEERLKVLALDQAIPGGIPRDLVVASASGLDPHIGPDAARYQIARIAHVREIGEAELRALVDRHTVGPQFGVLGAARVNVLALNLDLPRIK